MMIRQYFLNSNFDVKKYVNFEQKNILFVLIIVQKKAIIIVFRSQMMLFCVVLILLFDISMRNFKD